ncbi:MAG: hypothetical protein M1827_001968 [Pycnora praestabilis]|nr:MAG: hypothetical protein M1827_001968 [Pycnora praestabilis]
MRISRILVPSLLLNCASSVLGAVSSWGFDDATVSIQGKGAGVGGGFKEKLSQQSSLSDPVSLGASNTLKILLTTTEDETPKRPHQAFLMVTDLDTDLETSYPLSLKENGKGKVELTQKDLPPQFVTTTKPLKATLILASFGSSKPLSQHIFDISVDVDPSNPIIAPEKPLRYGKLAEIHHIFKSDPQNPPFLISMVFTGAVVAALPNLILVWLALGANFNHLTKALESSPVSHTLFFGSILATEGIFFMYYLSWNLFQTLPAAAAVGCVAFLSGSRALREVQERRMDGLR